MSKRPSAASFVSNPLSADEIAEIAKDVGLHPSQLKSVLGGATRTDVSILSAELVTTQAAIEREFQHFMHDNYFECVVPTSSLDGQWWQPANGPWPWALRTLATGARPALGSLKGIAFRSVNNGASVELAIALVQRKPSRRARIAGMLMLGTLAVTVMTIAARVFAGPRAAVAATGLGAAVMGLSWWRRSRATPTARMACERWLAERLRAAPKALASSSEIRPQ